jgi:hypothetical protein
MSTPEGTVRISRSGSDRSVELAIRGARRDELQTDEINDSPALTIPFVRSRNPRPSVCSRWAKPFGVSSSHSINTQQ